MLDPLKKRYRFRIIAPAYPAFNIYSNIASRTTALGPVYIATAVNKMERWDAEMIDENNLRRYGPRGKQRGADHEFLQKERPADVVGFYGGLTSTIPRLYELACLYKGRGSVTIAGGQHFVDENFREALFKGIDYIVIGEGEETIKELLEAIETQRDVAQVKGVVFLRNGEMIRTPPRKPLQDFDKLPMPDFSLVRYAKIKIYPVERIRGCGMDCEFCTVKGKPRPACPERFLEQIRLLVEKMDARHFFIVDDLFGQDRDETVKLCYQLRDYQRHIRRRLDFTAQIRLDKARDRELLVAMRQAGINAVAIGFESPIDEELKAMHKHIRAEEMLSMTKIFHQYEFLVHGMFIFGYPITRPRNSKIWLSRVREAKGGPKSSCDSTSFKAPTQIGLNDSLPKELDVYFNMTAQERVRHYQQFIRRARLDTIQILTPIPLPGTQLRERLKRQDRIFPLGDVGWEYYDGNFPVFEPDDPLNAEEMQTSAREIMASFYRFPFLFKIGLNILLFPGLVFFLGNIQLGWRKWYRHWRNDLVRFMGWIIIEEWKSNFQKDQFFSKLQSARRHFTTPELR